MPNFNSREVAERFRGGSRIYFEDDEGNRELIADTDDIETQTECYNVECPKHTKTEPIGICREGDCEKVSAWSADDRDKCPDRAAILGHGEGR